MRETLSLLFARFINVIKSKRHNAACLLARPLNDKQIMNQRESKRMLNIRIMQQEKFSHFSWTLLSNL